MKKFWAAFVVLSFIVIYIDGCTPSKPVEDVRVISADRLIKRLEANRRKIKTFSGSGTLMINSSSVNAKSSFEVNIKKPDSIKVSFFGPFGIDLAQVIVTQKEFKFYDIINNTVYQGRVRNDIMKKILKVDLPFDEVINALTGSVNMTDKLRIEPDQYEFSGNHYKLTYADSVNGIDNIYFVRNDDFAVTSFVYAENSKKILEGTYSDFNIVDEMPIPLKTIIQDSKNNQWMKIEYKKIQANKPIEDLKIEIPNDAKIIEW